MAVQLQLFLDKLIEEAIFRKKMTDHQKRSFCCSIEVDNATMPCRSLRKMVHKQYEKSGHHSSSKRCQNDEAAIIPRRSTTSGSPCRDSTHSNGISSLPISSSIRGIDLIPLPWNDANIFGANRSPRSVLNPPSQIESTFPTISPRSARWTSTFTPPQTLLKTKTGLKRLDSDSALACPQRFLLSPGDGNSSSSHSTSSHRVFLDGENKCSR